MITSSLLAAIFPATPRRKRDRFLDALNKFLPRYEINSHRRLCAFLATGGIETDYLKVTTEYASGADYEGRRDLGNYLPGDGVKFKGRGFFQTTGRYNFGRVNRALGKKLGIDFLKNPEKLSEIEIAVESACIFWQENDLAKYADALDFRALSAVVNCGNPKARPNHWAKRNELYSLCRRRVPADFLFAIKQPSNENEPQNQTPSANQAAAADLQSNENPALASAQASAEPKAATPASSQESDSFLNAAFDKNVSSEAVKTALPSLGARVWRYIARPLALLYAALEAGNVAAWLGFTVAALFVIYLTYAHRADFKRLFDSLKKKFTE